MPTICASVALCVLVRKLHACGLVPSYRRLPAREPSRCFESMAIAEVVTKTQSIRHGLLTSRTNKESLRDVEFASFASFASPPMDGQSAFADRRAARGPNSNGIITSPEWSRVIRLHARGPSRPSYPSSERRRPPCPHEKPIRDESCPETTLRMNGPRRAEIRFTGSAANTGDCVHEAKTGERRMGRLLR